MIQKSKNIEFEDIVHLIEEARNRAFRKVNEELVLLYFKVGNIVSDKVAAGTWGENTVGELADYITQKLPELSGFNRRGIYRMVQFYESYSSDSECFLLWLNIKNQNVSPTATHLGGTENIAIEKVSLLATQLENTENKHHKFVSAVLTQISWTNHLEIFSAVKIAEQRLFYMLLCIKEKWTKLELRRQIQSAVFERTMLSNPIVSAVRTQLPQNLFKDPYIFEFLDLPDGHSEKDLEKALIHNLQKFILELLCKPLHNSSYA